MSTSINGGPQRPSLAYAYAGPALNAVIKQQAEDFYVDEILGFEPSGVGEHVFLHIEKRCLTTLAVRDAIAKLAGCKLMDVGYSGLKDKWAVTRQWFSVYLSSWPDSPDLTEAQPATLSRHKRQCCLGTTSHKGQDALRLSYSLRDLE